MRAQPSICKTNQTKAVRKMKSVLSKNGREIYEYDLN